ncbi:MAG: 30S ribosomal protein S1 [Elusimicrobia bacterium]|nr:30S ribosomal protein S1 [Elusimicrobiota bacterium]
MSDDKDSPSGNDMEEWLNRGPAQEGEVYERLLRREVVEVVVVAADERQIWVDLGMKMEGVVASEEFGGVLPRTGDRVWVCLEKRGGVERQAVLSHRRAKEILTWRRLQEAHRHHQRISGTVQQQVKGGFLVDVGCPAFLPASQVDQKSFRVPKDFVGRRVEFYVLELESSKRRGILSRRMVLEEERVERLKGALGRLRVGQVLEGRIRGWVASGAWVELPAQGPGVEGFISPAEVSWRPIRKLGDVLSVGQKVRVQVLQLDSGSLRISLGMRQLTKHPAQELSEKYPKGRLLEAKLEREVPKGWIVSVKGDPGFLPKSEIPSEMNLQRGQAVQAIVSGVSWENFELLLSITKYERAEEKKKIRQYLKGAPPLTLADFFPAEKPGPKTD